ncbi:MAG: hypothetical protein Aurels2KO_12230 [Aureliella sp.]
MFHEQVECLLSTAHHGRVALRAFRKQLPELSEQIERDRGSEALTLWATSLNFDENAQARITDCKLLNAIGRLARCPIRDGSAYHAGLLHTYGYLLSQVDTPYGKKHERWTSGALESGLGLPAGSLLDLGGDSSLLQNATCLFTLLAGNAQMLADTKFVHPEILNYGSTELDRKTIREVVEIQGGDRFELDTHLIWFPVPARRDTALLIYGVRLSGGPFRLVTGFPVSDDSMTELLAPENFGIARSIRLRYNAVVEGFPAEAFGSRELIAPND